CRKATRSSRSSPPAKKSAARKPSRVLARSRRSPLSRTSAMSNRRRCNGNSNAEIEIQNAERNGEKQASRLCCILHSAFCIAVRLCRLPDRPALTLSPGYPQRSRAGGRVGQLPPTFGRTVDRGHLQANRAQDAV